jgi:hypothetical protein
MWVSKRRWDAIFDSASRATGAEYERDQALAEREWWRAVAARLADLLREAVEDAEVRDA